MSFLTWDLIEVRFLLHIWMNRMQNRALKIFPNTFTILKILKFSCLLRREKGLNQSIFWHTITDKAHNTIRSENTSDGLYPGRSWSHDFLGLHIQPSTNANVDTWQRRQTWRSTGFTHCKDRGRSSCCLQCPCSHPLSPWARLQCQQLLLSSPSFIYGTKV